MFDLFADQLVSSTVDFVQNNYHIILEILGGIFLVLLIAFHFRQLFFLAVLCVVLAGFAVTFNACTYGCVDCIFQKLINDGVCFEVVVRNRENLLTSYYHCDPHLIQKPGNKLVSLLT